jgi:hypothetical protein
MASRAQGWRHCTGLNGNLSCTPATGMSHWYYDDTAVGQRAADMQRIAAAHRGLGDVRGTVDMANRGRGWDYFQMDANGYHDIIERWFAETHSAVRDTLGCQRQENAYIDDWLGFVQSTGNHAIRPQLVVISSDNACGNQDCRAAYDQIRQVCAMIGSGRTIGITAEGGLPLAYGHCLGDVVRAFNECTCSHGRCF